MDRDALEMYLAAIEGAIDAIRSETEVIRRETAAIRNEMTAETAGVDKQYEALVENLRTQAKDAADRGDEEIAANYRLMLENVKLTLEDARAATDKWST